MQYYRAPIGFRLATAHPERITAIITQNGNAYQEGLVLAGRQSNRSGQIETQKQKNSC